MKHKHIVETEENHSYAPVVSDVPLGNFLKMTTATKELDNRDKTSYILSKSINRK